MGDVINKISDKDCILFLWGTWPCLIATKGHIKRKSKRVSQVIMSVREEHSKKPNETRERIVELIGDLPRIELFARQTVDGWDSWGNEV